MLSSSNELYTLSSLQPLLEATTFSQNRLFDKKIKVDYGAEKLVKAIVYQEEDGLLNVEYTFDFASGSDNIEYNYSTQITNFTDECDTIF